MRELIEDLIGFAALFAMLFALSGIIYGLGY